MEQTTEQTTEQTIESKMQRLNAVYKSVVDLNPSEYIYSNSGGAYQSHKNNIDREYKAYNIMKNKINTLIDELIPQLEEFPQLKEFHEKRSKVVGGARRNKKRTRRHKKKRGKKMRATRTKH